MAGSHSRRGEAVGDDSSRHLLKLARLDGGMAEVGAGRSDEVEVGGGVEGSHDDVAVVGTGVNSLLAVDSGVEGSRDAVVVGSVHDVRLLRCCTLQGGVEGSHGEVVEGSHDVVEDNRDGVVGRRLSHAHHRAHTH